MTFDELRRVRWREVSSFHMDALRALFGGRCAKCSAKDSGPTYWNGPRRPLEFAHVKPTGLCGKGRGLQHRFYDILRNRDCYALLCRKCHKAMDDRKWIDAALAAISRDEAQQEDSAA